MLRALRLLLTTVSRSFQSRHTLSLENLVLRQQLALLKRKHPRPHLLPLDHCPGFWSVLVELEAGVPAKNCIDRIGGSESIDFTRRWNFWRTTAVNSSTVGIYESNN
jgi:hypothetical protein